MRHRFKVKMGLFRKSVSELLSYGSSVVAHMQGNGFLLSPHPSLPDISSALAALQSASDKANGGGEEQTSRMHDNRFIVIDLLTECGHYVEDVANEPMNVDLETTIIESAGMRVRAFTPNQRRVFAAKRGKLSGMVRLVAGSVRQGFHEWAYTATPEDPTSWVELTSTVKASTTVIGLTSLVNYAFRHREILREGPQPWDDMVSLIVL